jgi:hypothetical protein
MEDRSWSFWVIVVWPPMPDRDLVSQCITVRKTLYSTTREQLEAASIWRVVLSLLSSILFIVSRFTAVSETSFGGAYGASKGMTTREDAGQDLAYTRGEGLTSIEGSRSAWVLLPSSIRFIT